MDCIGHSESRRHRYDYDAVTKAFARCRKVVEINANSAVVRPGNEENMRELEMCIRDRDMAVRPFTSGGSAGAQIAILAAVLNTAVVSILLLPVLGLLRREAFTLSLIHI